MIFSFRLMFSSAVENAEAAGQITLWIFLKERNGDLDVTLVVLSSASPHASLTQVIGWSVPRCDLCLHHLHPSSTTDRPERRERRSPPYSPLQDGQHHLQDATFLNPQGGLALHARPSWPWFSYNSALFTTLAKELLNIHALAGPSGSNAENFQSLALPEDMKCGIR